MRVFIALPIIAFATIARVAARAQSAIIQSCRFCPDQDLCITVDHQIVDDNKDVCDGDALITEWKVGTNFIFYTFATRCKFTITAKLLHVKEGEVVGFADCPGVKKIKGRKMADIDQPGLHGTCLWLAPFRLDCKNLVKLEWDGCLSCGEPLTVREQLPCDIDKDCKSDCCGKDLRRCALSWQVKGCRENNHPRVL